MWSAWKIKIPIILLGLHIICKSIQNKGWSLCNFSRYITVYLNTCDIFNMAAFIMLFMKKRYWDLIFFISSNTVGGAT